MRDTDRIECMHCCALEHEKLVNTKNLSCRPTVLPSKKQAYRHSRPEALLRGLHQEQRGREGQALRRRWRWGREARRAAAEARWRMLSQQQLLLHRVPSRH